MGIVRILGLYWRQILVIVGPVLLSPLVFPYDQTSTESKCSFIVLLVALFWVTELLPIPITALLPVALRPLLGISSSKDGVKVFFTGVTMLIIGGVIVASALEATMVHKRIAYMVLDKIGVQPRRLMLGVMLMTGFLSMWITNTASTAMMIPVTKALLERLYTDDDSGNARENETETETKTGEQESGRLNDNGASGTGNDRDDVNPVVIIETAKSEELENGFEDRSQYSDAQVEPSSEALLTFSVPRHNQQKHEQTRQKLDEILSRRHQDSPGNKRREATRLKNRNYSSDDITETLSLASGGLDKDRGDSPSAPPGPSPPSPCFRETWAVFSMCIAYSANIGGIGTLIGSAPNLLLSEAINSMSGRAELSFAQWSLFGLPVAVVTLLLAYIWMNILLFGLRSTLTCRELRSRREVELAARQIRQELEEMGPVRYNEKVALVHFVVLVLLLLTRRPGFVTGWSALFADESSIGDGSVAIAVAVSLFLFSNERPTVFCFRSKGDDRPPRSLPPLLPWKLVSRKFPWGVIILFGGGSVLVDTIRVSGLSDSITPYMVELQAWPSWLTCLVITGLTCLITELCSNTVITILVLPVLRTLTAVLEVHPLYLMFPATVATSMAFMLPVATPPNSLIFSFGGVTMSEMMKAGWVLNVIGICVIYLGIHTWGWYPFHLDTVPDWARLSLNLTLSASGRNSSTGESFSPGTLGGAGLDSLVNQSLRGESSIL